LDRGAKDITVLDIITGIDGPVALVNCADPSQAACRLRETCCMLGRWDGVNAAVRDVLAEVTLTDMMWKSDVCVDFVNEGS
jgi:DNA-binding IscR family transcriptional regulator